VLPCRRTGSGTERKGFLVAEALAVAVLALAVALLDLLLIFGIVRRLRAQATSGPPYGGQAIPDLGSGPARGSRLPEFTAVTVGGEAVDESRYTGQAGCIAFVSATCKPCTTALAELGPYLRSAGIGKQQTLVVVEGDPAASRQHAATAAEFAEVVTGEDADRLIVQFAISGFPTLITVQDGAVTASAIAVGMLRVSAAGFAAAAH
jgi:hypothetical protein